MEHIKQIILTKITENPGKLSTYDLENGVFDPKITRMAIWELVSTQKISLGLDMKWRLKNTEMSF